MNQPEPTEPVRLDKWLWAMRLHKTRALATAACRGGTVRVNGTGAKPSAKVRAGDRVDARARGMTVSYRILIPHDKRIGAARLPEFVEDQTPEEERERAREHRANARLGSPRGAGRPTKKDRRDLERFMHPEE